MDDGDRIMWLPKGRVVVPEMRPGSIEYLQDDRIVRINRLLDAVDQLDDAMARAGNQTVCLPLEVARAIDNLRTVLADMRAEDRNQQREGANAIQ